MSGEEDGNRLDSDGGRPVSILYRPISDYGVMKLHLGLKNKNVSQSLYAVMVIPYKHANQTPP
jgi:hypothetical protein